MNILTDLLSYKPSQLPSLVWFAIPVYFIPSFWLLEFKTLVETRHLLVLVKTPYNSSSPVSHQTKNENNFKFLISVVFSCNMAENLLLQIKCVYFPQVKSSRLNNDLKVFSGWIPTYLYNYLYCFYDQWLYKQEKLCHTEPPYLSSVIGSLSNCVVERRTSTGSGPFASLGSDLFETLG